MFQAYQAICNFSNSEQLTFSVNVSCAPFYLSPGQFLLTLENFDLVSFLLSTTFSKQTSLGVSHILLQHSVYFYYNTYLAGTIPAKYYQLNAYVLRYVCLHTQEKHT